MNITHQENANRNHQQPPPKAYLAVKNKHTHTHKQTNTKVPSSEGVRTFQLPHPVPLLWEQCGRLSVNETRSSADPATPLTNTDSKALKRGSWRRNVCPHAHGSRIGDSQRGRESSAEGQGNGEEKVMPSSLRPVSLFGASCLCPASPGSKCCPSLSPLVESW